MKHRSGRYINTYMPQTASSTISPGAGPEHWRSVWRWGYVPAKQHVPFCPPDPMGKAGPGTVDSVTVRLRWVPGTRYTMSLLKCSGLAQYITRPVRMVICSTGVPLTVGLSLIWVFPIEASEVVTRPYDSSLQCWGCAARSKQVGQQTGKQGC